MPEVALPLAEVLAEARAQLGAAGVPEPAREALRLWTDLNDAAAGRALLDRSRAVDPAAAARLMTAVGRRAEGEPLAYVTGRTGFRRLELRIDRRALIPRPETEGLVDLVLERVSGGRVADLGTGSGCIALSLATEGRYDAVLAVDSSAVALALAGENRQLTGAGVTLVRGDLTAGLAAGSLDALVSNPPYLTEREYAELDPAVSRWEPREALVSGADGLHATVRLLDEGRRVL
ncbi:MAG TPA: HemK/PrmC family methyltransferase, partial [Gemmatimonadales bacterium]|nr:HemK/PrmC family methyltransferase [Gemmatimonadales bacterium]